MCLSIDVSVPGIVPVPDIEKTYKTLNTFRKEFVLIDCGKCLVMAVIGLILFARRISLSPLLSSSSFNQGIRNARDTDYTMQRACHLDHL